MVFGAFLRFRVVRTQEQQPTGTESPHKNKDHRRLSEAPGKQQQQKQQRLLTINELPAWYDPNPFILSGYRPESRSWFSCLASWSYWHNETCNIYSHLIPGVFLLLCQGLLYDYVRARYPDLSVSDWSFISLQLLAGSICLLTSTMYHTLLNHSETVAHQWLQLDYVGIITLILGDFISGLHFGFYCSPGLKYFYWSLIIALSSATAVTLLIPKFRGPKWRFFRLASFIGTGLSAFAPIGHALIAWGPSYVWGIGTPYWLLEGLFLIIGCYFWERRVPESLYPGKFDLIGHSHTIWHVFVAFSVGAHVCGLLSALDYTYNNAWCRMN